ncbi:hypothetical protein PIB30_060836 [Stylosanthes scabra]|uniref:Uncharacterized protein n=1 Tax=Stylosanthes scabra TaxID=79078 RepID=A0ABU6TL13_9FABA|nr:hypothetical protein [Stylosanthes scabra]
MSPPPKTLNLLDFLKHRNISDDILPASSHSIAVKSSRGIKIVDHGVFSENKDFSPPTISSVTRPPSPPLSQTMLSRGERFGVVGGGEIPEIEEVMEEATGMGFWQARNVRGKQSQWLRSGSKR